MKLETDTKLDFNNVLIRPKRTTLSSRSQVKLEREFKFPNTNTTWKVPHPATSSNTEGAIRCNISNIYSLNNNSTPRPDSADITGVIFDKTPPSMTITSTNVGEKCTVSDRYITLVFTSTEDILKFTIEDITFTDGSGCTSCSTGVLSNFYGSGRNYTVEFAPSYDAQYKFQVADRTFTDSLGIENIVTVDFTFTYNGVAQNKILAQNVANWHNYNLNGGLKPSSEPPVETATSAFRKSLLPAATVVYDKIMMKAFHTSMNSN